MLVGDDLLQQRSEFYDSYVSGNTSVTILSSVGPASSAAFSAGTSPKSPPTSGIQPLLPRSSLMHAVRSCGLCPTEQELAAAELDALEPNGKFVTKDQFLEICEQLKSLNSDVHNDDVLIAFKSLIVSNGEHINESDGLLPPPSTEELWRSLNGTEVVTNKDKDEDKGIEKDPKKKKKTERFVFSHKEMRIILPELNDEQFALAMKWLDPQNTNQIDVRRVSELLSAGIEKNPYVAPGEKERNVGEASKSSAASPPGQLTTEEKQKNTKPATPPPQPPKAAAAAPKPEEKKASAGCCSIQ
eukprot:GILI01008937.1.p1 GENE.GILI01008937.1~~GILI01008937.1.p1  ORF type:complete len:300 (-),score=63.49 GILI01008937.1:267-1166(-)